jgi:hypothetical protein
MRRHLFSVLVLGVALSAGCASNAPPLPACTTSNAPGSICGLMNPEDLAPLPGREWIIVSQMARMDPEAEIGAPPKVAGNLIAIRVSDGSRAAIFPAALEWELEADGAGPTAGWGDAGCPGPPAVNNFEPHGIDVGKHASGAGLLAVVNHGGREAVEFFEIESAGRPSVVWRGCVEMPEDISTNDVALFADGSFVVTKMISKVEGVGPGAIWTLFKIAWGWDTGAVYRWRPESGLALVPGSEGSAPNGVAISKDQSAIFVAQWGEANVYRVPLEPAPSGSERAYAYLDHHPDNLTWTADGRLLAAGQDGSLLDILGCGSIEVGGCPLDYGVYSIDPATLEAKALFTGKGAASVALEVGDDIFVGVFSGDQVERVSSPR